LARVIIGANLRPKGQGHWEQNVKMFLCISSSKMDQRQTKTKMINNAFHQRKWSVFVIFVCLSVTYLSFSIYWNVMETATSLWVKSSIENFVLWETLPKAIGSPKFNHF